MSTTESRRGDLCAVVLAAGLGTRLRPLTNLLPKPLCPINNVPLLDLAIDSVRPFATDIAVNVHYLPGLIREHLRESDIHISDESGSLLGSAGTLGHLHEWIAGRDVLVRNSDAYLTADLAELVDGWDGQRPRLLGKRRSGASDFGDIQYVGACLLPGSDVARLPDEFASLYDVIWKPAFDRGEIDFVLTSGDFVDCGTPADYLHANLIASGGRSVIGPGAVVEGEVLRSVVWSNGRVGPDELLTDCIRVGADLTVEAAGD